MSLKAREAVLETRVKMLTWFCCVVVVWAVMATGGWMAVQRKVELNLRPVLPNENVVLESHGIDPVAAFQFVAFQLQSIYNWKTDGETDFAVNLRNARENRYISQDVYTDFRKEYFERLGRRPDGSTIGVNTLKGRERIDTVPKAYFYKPQFVETTSEGVLVTVILEQKETVNGAPIKSPWVQYQYMVVRNSEADTNEYGLQILERIGNPVRVRG